MKVLMAILCITLKMKRPGMLILPKEYGVPFRYIKAKNKARGRDFSVQPLYICPGMDLYNHRQCPCAINLTRYSDILILGSMGVE